jgi:hypothetical protein
MVAEYGMSERLGARCSATATGVPRQTSRTAGTAEEIASAIDGING